MEFKQAHYCEIIIDEKFFNRTEEFTDVNGFLNLYYGKESEPAYSKLHNFLNYKFASEGFQKPALSNKASFVTTDVDNIIKAQAFLRYLFENKDLETTVKEHINGNFKEFLEKIYEIYLLNESMPVNQIDKKKQRL